MPAGDPWRPEPSPRPVETIELVQAFSGQVTSPESGASGGVVFSDPLLDRAGSPVGRASFHCVPAFGEDLCRGALTLEGRGTIVVDGVAPHRAGPFSLAVTGGTGDFAGVAGQVDLAPDGDRAQRVTVRLVR